MIGKRDELGDGSENQSALELRWRRRRRAADCFRGGFQEMTPKHVEDNSDERDGKVEDGADRNPRLRITF